MKFKMASEPRYFCRYIIEYNKTEGRNSLANQKVFQFQT